MTLPVIAFPLKSEQLRDAAEALIRAERDVRDRMDIAIETGLHIAAMGFDGEAPQAGLELLNELADKYLGPARALADAAEILATAADLQRDLEYFAEQVMAFSSNPLLYSTQAMMITWLNTQAAKLDEVCAAELMNSSLCGTEAAISRFADQGDRSLEDISADFEATLPPDVREAIERTGGVVLEGGPGGYTVMVGDTVDPASIVTVVSGVSSGGYENLPGQLYRAQQMAQATGGAVIVWQGYSAPKDLVHGINPGPARLGADDLARFQGAVDKRYPSSRQVVLGHSYGSVVVATAAKEHGLHADDLILAGSPGVPAANADELTLIGEDPRVFVADSDHDIIEKARTPLRSIHGHDPSRPGFGAIPIEGIRGGHSSYFDDPAFLRALKDIADDPLASPH